MTSSYRPDKRGLAQIGRSAAMGAVSLEAAQRLANTANAVGKGRYAAGQATVTTGFDREARAGARVFETKPHPDDAKNGVLKRIAGGGSR